MSKKNILFVAPYISPEGGGLGNYAFKVAKRLSKKNNVVALCATKKQSKIDYMGFKIIRQRPSFFISNTPIKFGLKKIIEPLIKKYKIDLISLHTPVPFYTDVAAQIANKYNIPYIVNYHSGSLYKGRPLLDLLALFYENLYEKNLFKNADKIIARSPPLLREKLAKYQNKTFLSLPFINLKLFRCKKQTKKEILFTAQLDKAHKWKGLDNLLKAFQLFIQKNKDYKLMIMGDGDYRVHYEKLARKLGLENNVNFLGKLGDERVKYFQSCKFVVSPSTSHVEGTATVLIEAMACGKPIIGGQVGGIPDIIKKEKCGVIVNAKNILQLASKMHKLANDSKLYKELSQNCLKNIKDYEEKKNLKYIEKIFDSVTKKKIAIFHNFMDNIGGAEKVGLTLARDFKADFYSTNIDKIQVRKMGFSGIKMKSIGKVPVNVPIRQQAVLQRFRNVNLKDKYDCFIIDGDWAMSGAVNNKPNIWYVHSPIRELWDLYEYRRRNIVIWFLRPMFDLWVLYNRYLNKKYIKYVNRIICNSENTRQRVKKYLGRESVVVNPPIETSQFKYKKNGNYWLSVNRLVSHKRVDLQINAFAKMPNEKLVIIGSYEKAKHFKKYVNYIKKIKLKNVQILSWVNQKKLIDLYANCRGFITTSKDEDFGMNVVEAMASGKPVIASNEGGHKETMIDGKTGRLIDNINVDKLVDAVKEVGKNPGKYKQACLKQAKKFDTKEFIKKIREQMER